MGGRYAQTASLARWRPPGARAGGPGRGHGPGRRTLRFPPGDATYGAGPAPGQDGALKEDGELTYIATAAGQTAATGVPVTGAAGVMAEHSPSGDELRDIVLASLEDDKAVDIVPIGLGGRSTMADWMVVCSGRSSRQVAAIADHLVERLKARAGIVARIEGRGQGDWVLIDAGDVVVHVFRPEVREFYQLEKMWQAAPRPAVAAAGG
ncbi:MAG: ribosome silencing factor [Rhodobacteraceae bacterium]|nr:ribosome silencing factor [Paracoccaceae bacterium]